MASDGLRLRQVKVERFKAAFKPDAIALSGFDVVIGRNGSGKSTLIEALQWLDKTIRRDARDACARYHGVSDLVNLRSQTNVPYFRIELDWDGAHEELGADGSTAVTESTWRYQLKVEDRGGVAKISDERLDVTLTASGRKIKVLETKDGTRRVQVSSSADGLGWFPVRDSERLALTRVSETSALVGLDPSALADFWSRAVFLRLSPNRLAEGSLATRRSFDPLLDEEGQNLPALLNELTDDQREQLVDDINDVLEGFEGIDVSKAEAGRDTRVHYNLLEKMPYRGRAGRKRFPVPAWMLSEGTRRITALLALLVHDPLPSLLCVEEVENGLDPWTTRLILKHLQAAASKGVQIVLTTHSPWLLDDVPLKSILQVTREQGDTRYVRFFERPEIKAYAASVPAGTMYVNEIQ